MARSSSYPTRGSKGAATALSQRLSAVLPGLAPLVGGSVSLLAYLAYLALHSVTLTCYDSGIQLPRDVRHEVLPARPRIAAYRLGPLGGRVPGLPLSASLRYQPAFFGPAALRLLAALPALVADRSAPWSRASGALDAIGGLYGLISVLLLGSFISHASRESAVGGVGFSLRRPRRLCPRAPWRGSALAALGLCLRRRRSHCDAGCQGHSPQSRDNATQVGLMAPHPARCQPREMPAGGLP